MLRVWGRSPRWIIAAVEGLFRRLGLGRVPYVRTGVTFPRGSEAFSLLDYRCARGFAGCLCFRFLFRLSEAFFPRRIIDWGGLAVVRTAGTGPFLANVWERTTSFPCGLEARWVIVAA